MRQANAVSQPLSVERPAGSCDSLARLSDGCADYRRRGWARLRMIGQLSKGLTPNREDHHQRTNSCIHADLQPHAVRYGAWLLLLHRPHCSDRRSCGQKNGRTEKERSDRDRVSRRFWRARKYRDHQKGKKRECERRTYDLPSKAERPSGRSCVG